MSLPDIVAAAFGMVARNSRRFLALALPGAILYGFLVGSQEWVESNLGSGSDTSKWSGVKLAALAGLSVGLLLVTLLTDTMVIPAAFDAILGRRLDAGRALRRFFRVLPAAAALWLILTGVTTFLLATVILVPFAIFLSVRWSFALQEVCWNDIRPSGALRASFVLVQGTWWRVFIVQIAIAVLGLLPQLLVQPVLGNIDSLIFRAVLSGAAFWIAAPFTATARTTLYADVRLRKGERLQPPAAPAATLGTE